MWTWAATLLQSSNVAYKYGISGPFWYASGATIQVLLFAVLAVEIKRKCPAIHTICEVILARWGTAAHLTIMCFVIATQLIVTGMLILGGAAVVNALSGMDIYAASFLIPLAAAPFTMQGGLLATFISSWAQVAIIYVAMLIFLWKIYVGQGSDLVWESLMLASEKNPVLDNREGTYLTMWSTNGLIFGICNIVGNFGTVFVDNAYWQNAIAARPSGTYKGYLMGGIAWFSIPFSMATTLGLAARSMDLPITKTEAGLGLVPPAVAVHILGEGGAFLILFQLFMAVTATACAEQISASAVFAYDIYKRYMHPGATGKQILFVSQVGVFMWSVFSGVLATILFELEIGLGWIYVAMGNFIGSAVFPVAFALTWKRCSAVGAIAGCWCGLGLSMLAWCLAAQSSKLGKGEKVVNVNTLGDDLPSLAGNLVALFSSPVICIIVSLISPQRDFEWEDLKRKTEGWLVQDDISEADRVSQSELIGMNHGQEDSEEELNKVLFFSYWFGGGLSFVLIIVWPLLTLPQVSFSKDYWSWWVAIGFLWAHGAAVVTMVYPLWEIRAELYAFISGKKPEEAPAPTANKAAASDPDLVIKAADASVGQAAQDPAILLVPNPRADPDTDQKFLVGSAFGLAVTSDITLVEGS
jgi:urea-proton symporter